MTPAEKIQKTMIEQRRDEDRVARILARHLPSDGWQVGWTPAFDEPKPKVRREVGLRWALRQLLAERDGAECYLCGGSLSLVEMVIEHIIPKEVGGSDDAWNLGLACPSCNQTKGRSCVSLRLSDRAPCYAAFRVVP